MGTARWTSLRHPRCFFRTVRALGPRCSTVNRSAEWRCWILARGMEASILLVPNRYLLTTYRGGRTHARAAATREPAPGLCTPSAPATHAALTIVPRQAGAAKWRLTTRPTSMEMEGWTSSQASQRALEGVLLLRREG